MEEHKDSMEEVWRKLREKGVKRETREVLKRGIEKAALEEICKGYEICNGHIRIRPSCRVRRLL